jgi:uncharacterized membrane protein YbhN (UPF0104 family)
MKRLDCSNWLGLLRILSGTIVLVFLIAWFGTDEVLAQLSGVDEFWLLWIPVLLLINLVAGGIGLFALFQPHTSITLLMFLRYHFFTQSLGAFLPLQIGESSIIVFLKQQGVSLPRAIALFVTDKATSLIVLGTVGGIGLFVVLAKYEILTWGGLGLLVLVGGIITLARYSQYLIRLDSFLRQGLLARAYIPLRTFVDELVANHRGVVINISMTCLRRVFIEPLMLLALLLALGSPVPWLSLVLITNILGIVSLIPITAQGLGLVELSAVYLFSLIHVDSATTIAVYLLARPLSLGFSGLILAVTGWAFDIRNHGKREW